MIDINHIVHEIVQEAHARLEAEPEAPGGLNAKLHNVLMEIGLKLNAHFIGRDES